MEFDPATEAERLLVVGDGGSVDEDARSREVQGGEVDLVDIPRKGGTTVVEGGVEDVDVTSPTLGHDIVLTRRVVHGDVLQRHALSGVQIDAVSGDHLARGNEVVGPVHVEGQALDGDVPGR